MICCGTSVCCTALIGTGIVGVLFFMSVKKIKPGYAGIILRQGQFKEARKSGIVYLIPFIDKLNLVNMNEQLNTIKNLQINTSDNQLLKLDAFIYYQIHDPINAVYNIPEGISCSHALDNKARELLAEFFSSKNYSEALLFRNDVNTALRKSLENTTIKWGIKINKTEIIYFSPD